MSTVPLWASAQSRALPSLMAPWLAALDPLHELMEGRAVGRLRGGCFQGILDFMIQSILNSITQFLN